MVSFKSPTAFQARAQLRPDLHGQGPALEPTYTPSEIAAAWGISLRTVRRLIALGRAHRGLHPLRGGLWPVWCPSARAVRIPAGALQRHLDHVERVRVRSWPQVKG
jgi:hypothetical protein